MGTSYPNGIKPWSPVVNGVDHVQSSHVNDLYSETIAMERDLINTGKCYTATGTANSVMLSLRSAFDFSKDGNTLVFIPVDTNTSAVAVSIDGTNKAIKKYFKNGYIDLAAGDIKKNTMTTIIYNVNLGYFVYNPVTNTMPTFTGPITITEGRDMVPNIAFTSITGNGTLATGQFVARPTAPYAPGDIIHVTRAEPIAFNGIYTVTNCTTSSITWAQSFVGTTSVPGMVQFVSDMVKFVQDNGWAIRQLGPVGQNNITGLIIQSMFAGLKEFKFTDETGSANATVSIHDGTVDLKVDGDIWGNGINISNWSNQYFSGTDVDGQWDAIQEFPGGLVVQFGHYVLVPTTLTSHEFPYGDWRIYNFPLAFPHKCYGVVAVGDNPFGFIAVEDPTPSQFPVMVDIDDIPDPHDKAGIMFSWVALGY